MNLRLAVGQKPVQGLVVALIAVAGGIAVSISAASLPAIAVLIVLVLLLAAGSQSIAVFHGSLVVLLAGYAFFGKGFAYLGIAPLYVGELCLAAGVLAIIQSLRRARFSVTLLLLLLFMSWGLVRTIPYIGTYGLLAVRDGVTWAYGLFAIAVLLTIRSEHLDRVVAIYRRGALLLVWWIPVATVLTLRYVDSLPGLPGAPVPVIFVKVGDSGVQLAGIAAFALLGLYSAKDASPVRQLLLWVGWFLAIGVSVFNRGAMLAIATAAACLVFVFPVRRVLAVAFVGTSFAVVLLIVNPTVDLGLQRTASIGQVIANITSITGSGDRSDLQTTRDWRLEWWGRIYDYTVNGPYQLLGKGFGINLATDDGFQVDAQESLRAPHNTHVEILARAGVPGVALWLLFQGAYAIGLLRAARTARRIGEPHWVPLLGWVFVYWLAAVVNATFDVYLGGPQGGIWFWSMIGLGLGLVQMVNDRARDVGAGAALGPGPG